MSGDEVSEVTQTSMSVACLVRFDIQVDILTDKRYSTKTFQCVCVCGGMLVTSAVLWREMKSLLPFTGV